MQPLKVGIVDSGIALNFLHLTPINLVAGANFKIDWSTKTLNSVVYSHLDIDHWRNHLTELDIADHSGHGTAVASILFRNIIQPVEFYVAKILNEQASGSALCLIAAMNWLLNHVGVQYINLSLGTNNWQCCDQLTKLVNVAQLKNCQLFSAAGDIPTLPSELEGVISVGTKILAQANTSGVKIDCIALPHRVTAFHDERWIEADMSTSYACPFILAEYCNRVNTD